MPRRTLFESSGERERVNGYITHEASKTFEKIRRLLKKLSGYKTVSDGNVVEALVRTADVERCGETIEE